MHAYDVQAWKVQVRIVDFLLLTSLLRNLNSLLKLMNMFEIWETRTLPVVHLRASASMRTWSSKKSIRRLSTPPLQPSKLWVQASMLWYLYESAASQEFRITNQDPTWCSTFALTCLLSMSNELRDSNWTVYIWITSWPCPGLSNFFCFVSTD